MEACTNTPLNLDLSENVDYNNPNFPVYIKEGRLSTYPNFSGISHWHDDLEFIVILNGDMYYDVNGQAILLKENEGIFVNSHCFHYGYSNNHNECDFICILLSPSLLSINSYFIDNYLNPLITNRSCPYQKLDTSIRWQNELIKDLKNLYRNNKDEIKPYEVMGITIDIFKLLFENMNIDTTLNKDDNEILSVTKMMGYVQKNYMNKILVKDIAMAGECCKTKCSALFQKYLNTSPMLYLNNYRLEKSISLLRNTSKSITEVAYECGFLSTSYYCEQFNKYCHKTPKDFRQANI